LLCERSHEKKARECRDSWLCLQLPLLLAVPRMPSTEELGNEIVRLSGREGPQAGMNGDYQILKGQPIYWCESNQMCIYAVQGKWVLGKLPPSQQILALVDDNAAKPQDIKGTWAVFVGTMQPDPKIKIAQIEYLDKAKGSLQGVVVKSRYGNINGGYKRTEELCNEKHVYVNDEHENDVKLMWFHGECWAIGPTAGVEQIYTNSQLSQGLPHEAKWDFVVEPVCFSGDIIDVAGTYVDSDFPPQQSSIGRQVGECEWIRGTALGLGKPMLYSTIEPRDVMQGALGDCWLLAALAALAEFPGYIQDHVLMDRDVTPDGKYTVRLYDIGTGWKEIVVDDLIPCHKKRWCDPRAVPCFSQPHHNELYILLIEKAFAKYAGSYDRLSGGCESVAWQILTGQEEQLCWDRGEDGNWSKGVLFNVTRIAMPNDLQNGQWVCTTDTKDDDAMFCYLTDCDISNYLIGAAIPGSTLEKCRDDGLVELHAYSLITAREVCGFKLLRLRNPWGCQEWNGAWSDESAEWQMHPEVKAALQIDDPACPDGVFYISWKDFRTRFTRVFISPMSMERTRASHKVCPVTK